MSAWRMDEIMRQRDPALKEAVEASLKGDIARAFDKLGSNVAEVKPDNIAGAVAARWLRLDAAARENTGVMAPSHELRQAINGHIRERLDREGRIHGPRLLRERTPGLEGLHQCREGARRQLRRGRRGGLPPALQADRRREGRRAARGGP